MAQDVRHDAARSRYELEREDGIAFAEYERRDGLIIATHTVTPPALRGRGIASRLIKAMLGDARAQGLKVLPLCSFVADYFDRHPEEQDLRAD
ncbi:MAG: N-acetyltransferase [Sphingobium sp.]|nr:N-acetyltransferase [Sphingobium sp.]